MSAAFAPEVSTSEILAGNYSNLSYPILVACRDAESLNRFIFREGLICSEVRRLNPVLKNYSQFPADKVLLLLPDWHEDALTAYAVDHWVHGEDRYTVALPKSVSLQYAFLAVAGIFILLTILVVLSK